MPDNANPTPATAPGQPQPAGQAPDQVPAPAPAPAPEGSGKHLASAFKTLACDPVGKMMDAYRILGEKRAGGMGVALGAGFIVCLLIGLAIRRFIIPDTGYMFGNRSDLTAKETMAIIVVGAIVVLGMAIGSLIFRALYKDGGSFSQDLFAAGISIYPMAPMVVLAGLTSSFWKGMVANAALMFGSVLVAVTFYAAGTDLHGMNRRVASMMSALVLMATTGTAVLVYRAMF